METGADTLATANELGAPRPLPGPQTSALAVPADVQEEGANALAATPPSVGQTMAQNTIKAGQVNHGDSRDWAENAVAGVQAALAGFGAAGKVPAGAGALYGVGKAAEQAQGNRQEQAKVKVEQQQRQEQIANEEKRTQDQEEEFGKDYQLKLAENARQQAASVREMADHDARMRAMDDTHKMSNFQLMHEDLNFRQGQLDREDALNSIGAKPVKIAGVESPSFDDLGQLEEYASANNLGTDAHLNGYRTRPVLGADGKYKLYEVPDAGPEWHTLKGPDGKPTKIFTDPLGALNYDEKVAQINEQRSSTSRNYALTKKELDDYKDQGTVKEARKELEKSGGDYSKLSAGAREALTVDAQKRYQLTFNAYQAAQRDMQHDPDFSNVPINEKTGSIDTASKEYQELESKYHVQDANEQLGASYDELRQLGHGYRPFNQQQPKPGTVGNPAPLKPFEAVHSLELPKPGAPGMPITRENFEPYLREAGGNVQKAKAAAQAAGWGDPNQ